MDEFITVAKRELSWEVDYLREADSTRRFYNLLQDRPQYKVPRVIGKIIAAQVFDSRGSEIILK